MDDADVQVLLQVCPNDHPPFREICRCYAAAAKDLGWRPVTVFLGPPRDEPLDGARYLNAASLRHTARLAPALRSALSEELAAARGYATDALPPGPESVRVLAVCHRYRALRALLASRIAADQVVTVAHEFGFFARRQRRLWLKLHRLTHRRRLWFAGVSDAVQRDLRAVVPDALLLPNVMDLAWSDAHRLQRQEARRMLDLAEDSFVVAVVGRLHPKKAPQLALDGFRLAVPHMPGARLLFIGTGELAASLQREARDLPVTFTGFLPDAARCFSGLDLLLLPASWAEAFGMVVLEAMAAGLPVLSSAAPGPRFVLGETGDYFQPATPDALAQALCHAYQAWQAGQLAGLARAARHRAATSFSRPAAVERLRLLDGLAAAASRQ